MFNPLGAVTAGYRGYEEGRDKAYEKMGLEALGKAFQQPQMQSGPIDQMNSNPSPSMPMAPPPGQASQPGPTQSPLGPMAQGPLPQSMPPMQTALGPGAQGPMPAPTPQAAQPSPQSGPPQQMAQGGAPSAAGQPPSQAGGQGMDLYSLSRRIQMANPNLPPQALVSALTRALPLLNVQAKQQLLDIRRQMYGLRADTYGRSMDLRERAMDQRDKALGQRDQRLSQPPPEAIKALREGHVTTFANGTQWTLEGGQPRQIGGGTDAMPREGAPVGGGVPGPQSMTDEQPDPIRPGQQYAAVNSTGDNYLSPDSGTANRIPMGVRVATGTERRPPPQEPDTLRGSYDTVRRDAQNTISQGVTDLQGGEPARGADRILHGGLEYILAPGQALSQRFLGRPLDYNMLIPGNAAAAGARAGADRAQRMRSQDSPMERLGPRADAGADPIRAGQQFAQAGGNYNPMQREQIPAEQRPYRGQEIPMEEFERRERERNGVQHPTGGMNRGPRLGRQSSLDDPMQAYAQASPTEMQQSYAGNLNPREAQEMRLRLRLPHTIGEFQRHFGRGPETDAEIDAYSDQLDGQAPPDLAPKRSARVPTRGPREAAPIGGASPPE